ncbi:phosphoglycolate phosphatase [Halomonas sp. 18H]|uniref:phosphoglycolate phosphatase n=1 Tax=Halomonas almeriensis TaxID=308163 RepID=UPI00222F8830|nr:MULTISPECIES: phosphoglycolate phosphatase [Halomonas]MCW4149356.1 phosphoglycolate phosphatase [Halomonas sp. 18H]MDN3553698.1 phosphoglycolate phosphatase [Halomonas almeriensis]
MHRLLDDIQLIGFDLDGTLVDSVPDLAAAVDAALCDLGFPAPGEGHVRDWVGNGSRMLMERALCHALDEAPDDARCREAHDAFLCHYARRPCHASRLYPGVAEALPRLHAAGLTLVLVTNKPAAFIAPILEHFGLSGYFSLCLGGDSLARRKPDPLPLQHAAEVFAVSPAHCLMVGDSRHDIAAGRAAGYRTLAVPYGYNHGEPVELSEPDGVIESLVELL